MIVLVMVCLALSGVLRTLFTFCSSYQQIWCFQQCDYLFVSSLSIFCLSVHLSDCVIVRLYCETSANILFIIWHSAYSHQPYVDTLYVLLLCRCRPKLVLTRTSIPLSDCLSACFWGDLRVSGKRLPKPSQQTKRMSWNLQNRGQQVNNISKVALGKRKNICEWRSVQDRVTLW